MSGREPRPPRNLPCTLRLKKGPVHGALLRPLRWGQGRRGTKRAGEGILELAVMANVLNPETESTTLNTELETPTLEPAAEQEQPSYESTSNPEPTEATSPALDADTTTEPVAQATENPSEMPTAPAEAAAGIPAEETAASAELSATSAEPAAAAAVSAPAPAIGRTFEGGGESMEDFSAALEAFEREQAAEAAAVEAYGDKVVSGTVLKQTEKHLVVDVGLKSEGLVPLEQVVDHTGAVKFNPGDVIDVVIEREEPEGGYLVSFEKAQRLRVWDTIEKAANEKTPVMGTIVSRVKGWAHGRYRYEGVPARLSVGDPAGAESRRLPWAAD